jgi:hypothetical protein
MVYALFQMSLSTQTISLELPGRAAKRMPVMLSGFWGKINPCVDA